MTSIKSRTPKPVPKPKSERRTLLGMATAFAIVGAICLALGAPLGFHPLLIIPSILCLIGAAGSLLIGLMQ